MRRPVGIVAAALCALVAVFGIVTEWRPFVTTKADVITATPSLGGLFQRDVVELGRSETACVTPVIFSPEVGQAQMLLVGPAGAGPAQFVASGEDGYTSEARAVGFGTGSDANVRVKIEGPERLTSGQLCVRNLGTKPFGLVGTAEGRSNAPATTLVDGEPQAADVQLTLFEAQPESILGRFGEVLDRASLMTSGLLPRPLLWLVAVLMVAAFVLGVPYALYRAVREDDDVAEPPAGGSVRA